MSNNKQSKNKANNNPWVCCNNAHCTATPGSNGTWAYIGAKNHTSCSHCNKLFPRSYKPKAGKSSPSSRSSSKDSKRSSSSAIDRYYEFADEDQRRVLDNIKTKAEAKQQEEKDKAPLGDKLQELLKGHKKLETDKEQLLKQLDEIAEKFVQKQSQISEKQKEIDSSQEEINLLQAQQTKAFLPEVAVAVELHEALQNLNKFGSPHFAEAQNQSKALGDQMGKKLFDVKAQIALLLQEQGHQNQGTGEGAMEEDGDAEEERAANEPVGEEEFWTGANLFDDYWEGQDRAEGESPTPTRGSSSSGISSKKPNGDTLKTAWVQATIAKAANKAAKKAQTKDKAQVSSSSTSR